MTPTTQMLVRRTRQLLQMADLNVHAPFVAVDGALVGAPGHGWAQLSVSQFIQLTGQVNNALH